VTSAFTATRSPTNQSDTALPTPVMVPAISWPSVIGW
jgi:hypothetical protein